MTGPNNLTYVVHSYDQKEGSYNLLDTSGGLISRLRWHYYCKSQRKKFLNYYLFKTYGPPTHKFMKKFKELPPEAEKQNPSKYSVAKRDTHHGDAKHDAKHDTKQEAKHEEKAPAH